MSSSGTSSAFKEAVRIVLTRVDRLQNNKDTKLDTKHSSPHLKADEEVDYSMVPTVPDDVNPPALSRKEPNLLASPSGRPASGEDLTIYDWHPTFLTRACAFNLATGLLVSVGNANKMLEESLGEQLIKTIMPIFMTFALLEIAIVYSTFLIMCYLAFSTIGVSFLEDKKRYIRWNRIFGIKLSRRTTSIPGTTKIYIDRKKTLGIRYSEIRIDQDGPIIVRRFNHNHCLEIGRKIAEFLQLEIQDLSLSN